MGLESNERRVLERLDAGAMLERTLRWSRVNSGTRNLDGLGTMAGMLADAFAALPGTVVLHDPVPVETVGPDGTVATIPHGRHLVLSVRPDAPLRMLFTGHMDTVYPADHPFQSVTARDDGTVNGPGVADMKGGLSLLLEALAAIEAAEAAEALGYDVLVNSDEETGSAASAALIAALARGKVAAFTYEPALADGTLAGARGGTGNFSLVVRGRAAHAGRNPQDGRNALVAAGDLAVRLAGLAGPGLSVNPARIDGGGPNNVVPDIAVLRVNVRPGDAAAIARADAGIDVAVAEVAAARDVRIERHGSFNRPPKPVDPAAARLFALVKQAGDAIEVPIAWRDTGGVCDGNNIAAAGVPVVDTMGVRGGAIHSADEFMIVDSLRERAALSALTVLRIADGALA